MKPKVSVIMGIYNCEDTLSESIESILAQTYDNWELIMCDDASTDNTYIVAKSYAQKYPDKIIMIRNEKNIRLAGALNHCLRYATGKYVARMDGDDISMPERFEKQVDFLEHNLNWQVVGTGMLSFDEKGVRGVRLAEPEPEPNTIVKRNPFCHATVIMRSEVYKALDGYRVCRQTRRMEDLDLWIRFFEKGYRGYNLQEPLYKVRENSDAFKRRKLTYSIDTASLVYQACRRLQLPLKSYLYVLKPILAGLTPKYVMNLYHKHQLVK
jgi:glycosyltransferase EpsE